MNLPNGYFLQGKKYLLTKAIGQGGFGITYQGVWNTEVKGGLGVMKTTVPVCIKEYFFKDYCYRENDSYAVRVHSVTGERLFGKFKEKLIAEAIILSAVHHPNIVNVLEVFEENNTAYIVMEYIQGCSLKYLLDNKGILPEGKVIKYAHQIGNALSFVHEKNIVHLDIKPGNILIDHEDNARLIDFGVSKRFDIEEKETSTTTLTLSKGFASIEQYDEEGMSVFSTGPDIYALGATMYNLLTGVIPVESILRVTKHMLPPSAYNPTISSKTEKAILKAMEIKPENRFRKVNEFLAEIDAPTYDITENSLSESQRMTDEDRTEVIQRKGIGRPDQEDEDDKTIYNEPVSSGSKEKSKPLRKAKRRIALIASILLCAFIGYAVFSYFFDITSSEGTLSGLSLPGDNGPEAQKMALINQADSVESERSVKLDSTTNKNGSSEPPVAVKPQNNNSTQPSSTPANNPLTATKPETAQRTEVTNTVTPTSTPAQINKFERDYQDFIEDGKIKMSTGGYKGALDDFKNALEIAKKINKDTSESNRLIAECNQGIEMQNKESRIAKYEKLPKWGLLQMVRYNQKIGALDESGNEVIPCIYKGHNIIAHDKRAFIKDDNSVDIWDINGNRLTSEPSNP